MAEYIEREAAINAVFGAMADGRAVFPALNNLPAADVVSRGVYDQTDWERCVALTQLKEIGKSLGERMDDVRPVVLCRDCMMRQYCKVAQYLGTDGFCSNGEKREES